MKRINLAKFGFIRNSLEDFSDDGARFTCYYPDDAIRVRVTKTIYAGDVYINGSIRDGKLNYDEYSKLPHYRCMDCLNGTSIEMLTEEDLQKFYNDCIEYQKEYETAERAVKSPAKAEIVNILKNQQKVALDQLKTALDAISNNVMNAAELTYSETNELGKYLASLIRAIDSNTVIEKKANDMLSSGYARSFVKTHKVDTDSFYVSMIKSLLKI